MANCIWKQCFINNWCIFEGQLMRKLFLLILMLPAFSGLKSQESIQPPAAKVAAGALVLKEAEYDFGKIPQGKPVFYSFEIINQGNLPLKLDNVQASCGCTTPEWSKEPIVAGGADKIRVGYNAAVEGPFEKFITVTYNGNETKQIKIKGIVWKAPAGAAPANSSVQFLKQQMQ